jgi:homoserine dehydrogenase
MKRKLKLGIFGFGVVGQGLYHVLDETRGIQAEILKICVKNRSKKRTLPDHFFTFDRDDILENDDVDVVVELISDAEAAYEIVTRALQKGKSVVTSNKKMVADHMAELYELQQKHGAALLYEGSSCASIPIIRNLEEYYDNDQLSAIEGIFNGSTNYILTKIFDQNLGFQEALRQAQENGYAEADPSLDVEGYDAKYKLCIILAHSFGLFVDPAEVFNFGIQNINDFDIKIAQEKGYRIKLIARSRKIGNDVVAYVLPQFVSPASDLYKVENEYNAVIVESAFSEHQFFIGKGAGGYPTGSAVLSDISALTYDYKYEYKKRGQGLGYTMFSDLDLEVYVRFSNGAEINMDDFKEIREEHRTANHRYIIGSIAYQKLVRAEWLNNANVNVILTEGAHAK